MKKSLALKDFQKLLKENFKHNPIDLHNRSYYYNKDLDDYLNQYKMEMNQRSFQCISKATLSDEIANKSLVLFGDFHALDRSQKPLVEILLSCSSDSILLLECFKSSHNGFLSDYMADKITLDALIEKSGIETYWQYDLTQILEMLWIAKDKGLSVKGLSPDSKMKLDCRDQFAAVQIKESFSSYRKVLVLIGESHLASQHLPAKLEDYSQSMIRIVTNNDAISWMMLSEKLDSPMLDSNIFRMEQGFYSIQNASPWVKRVSESMAREESEQSLDSFNECGFDFEYFVVALCKLLGDKLSITAPLSLLENIHVHREHDQELHVVNGDNSQLLERSVSYAHHHIYMHNNSICDLIDPIVDHLLFVCRNSGMYPVYKTDPSVDSNIKIILSCCLDPIGVFAKFINNPKQVPRTVRPVRSKSTIQQEQALTLAKSTHDVQLMLGLLNSMKLSEIGNSLQFLIKKKSKGRFYPASSDASKTAS